MLAPAQPTQGLLRLLLRVVLPVLLLGLAWQWLLRHADLNQLWQQVQRLPAWAWLAALAALLGGHTLRALRVQREWQHIRQLGLASCLRLVLTHNAAVILMPLRSGEAGYLWLVRRYWGVGWRTSGLSLLRWRLQDATVLLLWAVLLLLPWTPAARLLLLAALITLVVLLQTPLLGWVTRRALGPGEVSGPGPQGDLPGGRRAHGWLASAGNWSLKILALGGLLMALADLPLEAGLRAALGGELAGVQPLQGPAGLGTYQAGVWLASGTPEAMQAGVVAAALAVHAFSLLVALSAAALAQLIPAPTLLSPDTPSPSEPAT